MMNRSLEYQKLLAVFLGICPILVSPVAQAASLIKPDSNLLYRDFELVPNNRQVNLPTTQNIDLEFESIYLEGLNLDADNLSNLESASIDSFLYEQLSNSYQLIPNQISTVSSVELFDNIVGSLRNLNFNLETQVQSAESTVIFLPRATAQNIFQDIYDSDITLGEYQAPIELSSVASEIVDPGRFDISLFQSASQPQSLNSRTANNFSNFNTVSFYNQTQITRYTSPRSQNLPSVVSVENTETINQNQSSYNPLGVVNQIIEEQQREFKSLNQTISVPNAATEVIEDYQKSRKPTNASTKSYQSVINSNSNISEKERKELERQKEQRRKKQEQIEARLERKREQDKKRQEILARKRVQQREKQLQQAREKQKRLQEKAALRLQRR